MCKSEIFAEILQFVSQETEISPEQILSNKKGQLYTILHKSAAYNRSY